MRKILFRGKRVDNGNWILGSLLKVRIKNGTAWMIFKPDFAFTDSGVTSLGHANVDPETVGQCTGLKDMNGKWIFEGDILRIFAEESGKEADGVCVVHFGRFKDTDSLSDFDHFGWYVTISTLPEEATTIFGLEEDGIAFEVIGNIHDNPELLEGGEQNER